VEIRQLKYFIEICKYKNFSRAAEECHISAQGVSMAVARLEAELSCKLFKRSSKGIEPTPQAEYLLPRAKKILSLMGECETYFSLNVQKEKFLPVVFSVGTIEEFAGPPIAEFMEKYSDVHLDIRECGDTICDEAVENREVELGLTVGPVDNKKFDAHRLFSTKHALIVRADHPLAERHAVSAQDLRDLPVAVVNETTRTCSVFKSACRRAGFELTVSTYVDNILLVYYLAEVRFAVGISTLALARRLSRPTLRAVPFDDPALDWNICLIKAKNEHLSREAQLFEKLLHRHGERQGEN
jgi:DNA-binding transcriptional LysR family regulator